jgi:hypothetical protein
LLQQRFGDFKSIAFGTLGKIDPASAGEAHTGIVQHRGQQCFDPLVVDIGARERAGVDSAEVPGKPCRPPMASSEPGRMLELAPFQGFIE